jgi:hypothetical protein
MQGLASAVRPATAKAKKISGTFARVAKSKALPPEWTNAARAFVTKIVERDFAGNVTHAAKAFGISQAMLYDFLEGNRGAGINLLAGVSLQSGASFETILGRTMAAPLNQHPDWEQAREAGLRMHPEIPAHYFDAVGRGAAPGEPREHIDAVFVAGLAREIMSADARAAARRPTP